MDQGNHEVFQFKVHIVGIYGGAYANHFLFVRKDCRKRFLALFGVKERELTGRHVGGEELEAKSVGVKPDRGE